MSNRKHSAPSRNPSMPPNRQNWEVCQGALCAPISGADKAVLGRLIDHADKTGLAWPSYETIAYALGTNVRSVRRSIANLIEASLIKRTHRYRRGENTTRLKDAQLMNDSNLYEVNRNALLEIFDACKERQAERCQRNRDNRNSRAVRCLPKHPPKPSADIDVGDMLGCFQDAWKEGPDGIPHLDKWAGWLEEVADNSAERPAWGGIPGWAQRLHGEVCEYLDENADDNEPAENDVAEIAKRRKIGGEASEPRDGANVALPSAPAGA